MPNLIIEDEEAFAALQNLAGRQGKSVAALVLDLADLAREELDRERQPPELRDTVARDQFWREFRQHVRQSADPEWLAFDADEFMYDEFGLPT